MTIEDEAERICSELLHINWISSHFKKSDDELEKLEKEREEIKKLKDDYIKFNNTLIDINRTRQYILYDISKHLNSKIDRCIFNSEFRRKIEEKGFFVISYLYDFMIINKDTALKIFPYIIEEKAK